MTKDKTTKDMADSVNEREIVLDILLELNRPEAMSHLVIGAALKKYQYLLKHQRSLLQGWHRERWNGGLNWIISLISIPKHR